MMRLGMGTSRRHSPENMVNTREGRGCKIKAD